MNSNIIYSSMRFSWVFNIFLFWQPNPPVLKQDVKREDSCLEPHHFHPLWWLSPTHFVRICFTLSLTYNTWRWSFVRSARVRQVWVGSWERHLVFFLFFFPPLNLTRLHKKMIVKGAQRSNKDIQNIKIKKRQSQFGQVHFLLRDTNNDKTFSNWHTRCSEQVKFLICIQLAADKAPQEQLWTYFSCF